LEHTDTLQVRNGVHTVQGFWRLKRSTVPAAVPNCVLAGDARQNEAHINIDMQVDRKDVMYVKSL